MTREGALCTAAVAGLLRGRVPVSLQPLLSDAFGRSFQSGKEIALIVSAVVDSFEKAPSGFSSYPGVKVLALPPLQAYFLKSSSGTRPRVFTTTVSVHVVGNILRAHSHLANLDSLSHFRRTGSSNSLCRYSMYASQLGAASRPERAEEMLISRQQRARFLEKNLITHEAPLPLVVSDGPAY